MRVQHLVLSLLLFLSVSLALSQHPAPPLEQGPKQEATGERVMVSTQLPAVTETALEVLRSGGNAVDAMVAAVFMQHVNDYHQVSHFGAMSALYYDAGSKSFYALNAVSERPLKQRSEHGDVSKVAIGGVVRGLEALATRFGSGRSWKSLLQPAIRSAEEGVPVSSFMYGINYALLEEGELLQNEEARRFYMPEGHLVPVGSRWKMPTLAETLRQVAEKGADYLYTGEWGQKFVKAANKKGFGVTLEDMAAYQAQWDEPVRFSYRGHQLLGSPPPDTGGLVVGANLNILENFALQSMGHYSESAETLEIMARAFGRVAQETRYSIRDPLSFQIPSALWLAKDYGAMGARFVRQTMLRPGVTLGEDAGESGSSGGRASRRDSVDEGKAAGLGSNHNVIVDAEGNWISLLHTGHGGAPDIFIDGVRATGSGARALTTGPGRRLVLPITAIMIARDGVPWLAMGTPGSPPQPVTEVLVNILDFGMPPGQAADAPRFWAFRNSNQNLEIESRISDQVRKQLASRGISIRDLGDYNWHTGSMQIVWRDEEGRLHGVSDPRRLGHPAGY